MSKELEFIRQNPMGFLATVDENDYPRVRGWGIIVDEEGNICFGTSNKKRVFKQLKDNPKAEWITMSKDMSTLRLSGDVVFETNKDIKQSIMDKTPMVKNHYAGKEDEFEVFYLKNMKFDWFNLKENFDLMK